MTRPRTGQGLHLPLADWRPLSPSYSTARRLGAALSGAALTGIATAVLGLALGWWGATGGLLVGLGWTTWRLVRAGRWVRAFRWAEREQDLLISQGLWFKHLSAIPYGRMLSVEVSSGPLDRIWQLASVRLVTASSESDALIPGLSQADATALRDRLIIAGQQQALPL